MSYTEEAFNQGMNGGLALALAAAFILGAGYVLGDRFALTRVPNTSCVQYDGHIYCYTLVEDLPKYKKK